MRKKDGKSSWQIGEFELIPLPDGSNWASLEKFGVQGASIDEVEAALEAAGLPIDKIQTTFAPLLLKRGEENILIDTGFGPDPKFKPPTADQGALHEHPEFDYANTQIVIISHFHPDHVNGLIADGKSLFPSARILVPRVEWDFWMNDAHAAQASPGRMQNLFNINQQVLAVVRDQVELFDWESEVIPGITAIGTPGHSAGHTSFMIDSGGDQLFFQADLTNQPPLFVAHPTWSAFFDQYPEIALISRIKTYDELARTKTKIYGFHHPYPGMSVIEKSGSGYVCVPVDPD